MNTDQPPKAEPTDGAGMTSSESADRDRNAQRRYISIFLVAICGLILGAFYFSTNALNYRGEKAIRFDQMTNSEVIVSAGLSRTQTVYLKLGYIEQAGAPDIAAIGNHQIQYFAQSAFGADAKSLSFFNLWGAASTLNDNFAYARLLEKLGKLPKLLIVHITTPNNDNGDAIIGHNPNMFAVSWQSGLVTSGSNILATARNLLDGVRARINETLDYISLVGAISNRLGAVVIDRNKCMTAYKTSDNTPSHWWNRILPNTLTHLFASKGDLLNQFCQPKYIKSGFLRDGSNIPPAEPDSLIINEMELNPLTRKLTSENQDEIVSTMKNIIALAERNKIGLVFLIPPVYETPRESVVDQIFSKALAEIPDRYVIDDRYSGRGRPEIFVGYDHPNIKYYKGVASELRARALLPTR